VAGTATGTNDTVFEYANGFERFQGLGSICSHAAQCLGSFVQGRVMHGVVMAVKCSLYGNAVWFRTRGLLLRACRHPSNVRWFAAVELQDT
jgi:hypothetical protein